MISWSLSRVDRKVGHRLSVKTLFLPTRSCDEQLRTNSLYLKVNSTDYNNNYVHTNTESASISFAVC